MKIKLVQKAEFDALTARLERLEKRIPTAKESMVGILAAIKKGLIEEPQIVEEV